MRIILVVGILGMLAGAGQANSASKAEKIAKHLSQTRQVHVKPILHFGNYGAMFGPSIALEVPIMRYFSLGGVFNAIFNFNAKTSILDFDVLLKALYPLRMGGYDATAYVAFPTGFSLALLPKRISPGFNFAMLPGFAFYIDRHWGLFTELGFNVRNFGASMVQGQFSIGLSYLL